VEALFLDYNRNDGTTADNATTPGAEHSSHAHHGH